MQVPVTTVEFLDALKASLDAPTDYRLGKILNWNQTTVSSYRVGRATLGGRHAIRAADELGLSRAYVLACMEAERERNDQVAHVWRDLARQLRTAGAIMLISLAWLLSGGKAQAGQGLALSQVDSTLASPCIDYAKYARLA